jgi:hypothetical protein
VKDYSSEALDAIERGEVIVSGAVAIYCEPPVFVFGGYGTIEIDGDTYVGIGDRTLAQTSSGAIGASEQNLSIGVSGIDPEALQLLEASEIQSAPAKTYRLVADGSGTKVLDCRIFKRGRVDQLSIQDVIGGTATVTAELESAARGLGRQGYRMRSDADQRLIDPLDGFFKHVSYAATKTIYLNGGKPSSAGSAAGA